MGRNLSPFVQQELENLEKDAESRRTAMKALKSYATNMDTKAIPQFLARVSGTNSQRPPSGECTISLYEVLARVHGRGIVPQIDSIMNTIMRTLSTSAGSFLLHQACSKVVPAIARYGIDSSTPDDEKKKIICSLCKPLCNALTGSHDCLASGAALCLKALVESNNWKFASDDIVNDVCLKVAGALQEKKNQTNSHMGLAMALVKHNSSIAEAYVASLIRSGLHMSSIGSKDNNSQKRFSAIQMINFLMKCTDSQCISSEVADIADAMEKCQADHMPFVRGAAFEALQTAKFVALHKGTKKELSSSPVIHLNFHRGNDMSLQGAEFPTPESQTIASSIVHENLSESPSSVKHSPSSIGYLGRRAQRRLWCNDLGGLDLSFKDSFFIKACSSSDVAEVDREQVKNDGCPDMSKKDIELPDSGFVPSSVGSTTSRDTTPSTQRSQQLTIHGIKIYTTPRKLIRSLQNQNDGIEMPVTNPVSCNVQADEHAFLNSDVARRMGSEEICTVSKHKFIPDDAEQVHQSVESVSSTADPSEDKVRRAIRISSAQTDLKGAQMNGVKMVWHRKSILVLVIMVCLSIVMSILRKDDDDHSFGLVPT